MTGYLRTGIRRLLPQGLFQLLPEKGLVEPRIDMIPRENIIRVQRIEIAVIIETMNSERLFPLPEREQIFPAIKPSAPLPSLDQNFGQVPVSSGEYTFEN